MIPAKLKSCLLRPDTGPCRADILSWYFDAKQEKCYRFFWGGCQGNGNRYTSRSECFNSCYVNTSLAKAKVPHFCSLAFEYGDCFGHYNRWGWDPILKSCKRRLYSGCGGNQNNFETKMECLATCVTGPNSSLTKRKVCLLRPDTGPCRADILSWYYDAKKQKCYRFFWGGCQGNGNNFISEAECKEECFLSTKMKTAHTPYFCQLAFDFGTCFGQYNRWTWDHIAGHCRRRLYSGCGGNQNNFETKEECMANCMSKPNNTLNAAHSQLTTCIPFSIAEFN
ncbi:hypothetical protein HW555_005280 [Spodoptera exigua]|uniref:BPTI/Kunitz inhibitor domain-containing protein n=1 Tax=Spodoptera exigua TaxID=7107 RepID=A0A835GIQ9_SPOEX|nr:hypothetical protein HW555_005280 [Spodoptera exigua]